MMDKLAEQPSKHRAARVSSTHEVPRDDVGDTMKLVTPRHGVADEERDKVKVWQVNEITARFDDTEDTAESLFSPPTFFEGTIESVETNAISGARVTVHATGFPASLLCDVDAEDVSSLGGLHRGETDFFVGSGARRFLGTVIFNHCKFVNPAS